MVFSQNNAPKVLQLKVMEAVQVEQHLRAITLLCHSFSLPLLSFLVVDSISPQPQLFSQPQLVSQPQPQPFSQLQPFSQPRLISQLQPFSQLQPLSQPRPFSQPQLLSQLKPKLPKMPRWQLLLLLSLFRLLPFLFRLFRILHPPQNHPFIPHATEEVVIIQYFLRMKAIALVAAR